MTLIQVAKRDADGALFLLGCVVLITGVARKVGPWEFESGAPPEVMIPLGLVLLVGGIAWIAQEQRKLRRVVPNAMQGTLPKIAFDPEFLLKAFINAMPAAFVKEVTSTDSSQHVLQSVALAQMQSLNDAIPLQPDLAIEDERRRLIKADHRRADERALSTGQSRQVEFLDALDGDPLRTVLTTKTRVEHEGRTFIVGWAVPVYMSSRPPGDTVELRHDSNVAQYELAPAGPGSGITCQVAEAVQRLLPLTPIPPPRDGRDADQVH